MIDIVFVIYSVGLIICGLLFISLSRKTHVDRATVRLQNFLRYFNSILFVGWFSLSILFIQSHGIHIMSTFDGYGFVTDLMVITYISTLIIAFCSDKIRAFCFPIYLGSDISKFDNCLLYLRAFSEDNDKGTNRVIKWISQYTYGIVAIANPNQVIQQIYGDKVYADDSEWKEVVSKAFEVARFIVINVADTDGCLWELHKCFEGRFHEKCVFLVTSEDSYNVLKRICYKYTSDFKMPRYQKDCHQFFVPIYDNDKKVSCWRSIMVYDKNDVKQFVETIFDEIPDVAKDVRSKNLLFKSPLKNLFRNVYPKTFSPFSFAGISILAFPFVAKLNARFLILSLPFLLLFIFFTIIFGAVNNTLNIFVIWAFALFICIMGKKMMFLSHNWVSEKVINNRLNYMVIMAIASLIIGYIFGYIYISHNPEILFFSKHL